MDTSLQLIFHTFFHTLSPELLSFVLFSVAAIFLLFFLKVGGASGLFCFINLAYITANIQVLHTAQFSFIGEPVALGTVLFAMTYLATDMLTEHYGAEKARKAVVLSFLTQIAFTLFMLITLAHAPLKNNTESVNTYGAMELLFMPAPRLMIASLVAYFVSQFLDIWVFKKISDATHTRFLWLRTGLATLLSALVDNILFSTLAWVVLSPHPVTAQTLIFTYILGTYVARFFVSILGIPLMYLSYFFKK